LTDTKNLNFGVGCLCQSAPKINFQKKILLSLDIDRPKFKPAVVEQRHHCLGGACAHAVSALEEPALALPGRAHAARGVVPPWCLRSCIVIGRAVVVP
jgi:hypothetical protein